MNEVNEEQLTQFVRDHQQKLYRFAFTYVHNEEDAKDILQNAILKAYRKFYQVKSFDKLSGWFYRILINESILYQRKHKHAFITEMDIYPGKSDDFLQHEYLYNMIHTLDEKSQMIVKLRFFEDCKLSTIAEITNLSISTVKNKLYKSLGI